MDDLIAFVTARLDEDEAAAKAWQSPPWRESQFLQDSTAWQVPSPQNGTGCGPTNPTAAARLIRPPLDTLPVRDGSGSAVAMIRAMTSRFVMAGNADQTSTAAPAACGADIDVPDL